MTFDNTSFWIHFTDNRAPVPVLDDVDVIVARLVEAGEVEGETFVVGGPF